MTHDALLQIQILRHVLALILRAFTSFALKPALSSLFEEFLKYTLIILCETIIEMTRSKS